MDADQRGVLLQIGGWPVIDMLVDPERGCQAHRASMSGGTFTWNGINCWREARAKGIWIVTHSRETLVIVPWTAIAAFSKTIPRDVMSQLKAVRAAERAEAQRYADLTRPASIGASSRRATEAEFNEHLVVIIALREATRAALTAALVTESALQLDLFAQV